MKNKLLFVLCILAMSVTLFPHVAFAAEDEKKQFSVSLRYWNSSVSGYNNFDPDIPEAEADSSSDIPMYGLSVGYSPRFLPNFDFILSAYKAEGDYQQNSVSPGGASIAEVTTERTDYELMVRHRAFPNKRAYLLYGFRWLNWDDTGSEVYPVNVPNSQNDQYDIYLGQLGTGFSTNITNDGKVNLFANIVLGYGQIKSEEEDLTETRSYTNNASALDLNVGVQWAITDMVSIHARYRMFNIGDDGFNFIDTAVVNGTEFGTTFSF